MEYDAENGDIVWSTTTIGPGKAGSRQVRLRVKASAESTMSTIARLAADRMPLSADTVRTTLCPRELSLLQLAVTDGLGGACARPGDKIAYTLRYGNPNTVCVHGTSLIFELPRATDFLSAPGGAYDRTSRSITWNIGDLEPGRADSVTVAVRVKAGPGEALESTLRLTAQEPVEHSVQGSTATCGVPAGNASLKVAIHVVPHGPVSRKLPVITACDQVVSSYPGTGEIDFFPVFYDLRGYRKLEFGITWPEAWGSCQFTVAGGEIWAGEIAEPGGDISIGWGSCQHTWSLVAGYGRLSTAGPGRICPVPNQRSQRLGAANCNPEQPGFDSAQGVYCAGIGGEAGDRPCPEKTTPWEQLKSLFR
jgi:hypothetical protein